jgi:uncharacterized glyoxalase superfamily protein PhnB
MPMTRMATPCGSYNSVVCEGQNYRKSKGRKRKAAKKRSGTEGNVAEQRVIPMIHVPDVRAAVGWYESIGFSVVNTFEDEVDGMTFAALSYEDSQIFLNGGGRSSTEDRREVDLYVRTNDVDKLYERLKGHVEIRIGLQNTFYGAREFIVRDLNGFWVTFGQDLPQAEVSS